MTESPAYLVGQVACGMAFPYATLARDFSADLLRGDYTGAALNSLGYLGTVRNILGTTSVIPSFIAKNPQKIDSGQEIMSYLWRQGIYHTELPAMQKVAMLDKAFDGAATRLSVQGVADDVIAGIYENNGNIVRTLKATKSETGTVRTIWLEEGKLGSAEGSTTWIRDAEGGSGWVHIRNNHVVNPGGNEFSRYGTKYTDTDPNYEENIRVLIMDAARDGIEFHQPKAIWRTYTVPDSGGRILKVLTGDNGYIVTVKHA